MQYYKNILSKYKLFYLTGTGTCWGILGCNRGINQYEYEYKLKYNNKTYLYTDKISYGIFGIIIYINPCFLPFIIFKELYRLEINLRNLNFEKKSEYYNKILF